MNPSMTLNLSFLELVEICNCIEFRIRESEADGAKLDALQALLAKVEAQTYVDEGVN